jgi:tetratricopeptide (TPR) repeat protein
MTARAATARRARARAARLAALAARLHEKGDASRPARLYRRALAIQEEVLGDEHPDVAVTLANAGLHLKALGRFDDARPLYERALRVLERTVGPADESVGTLLYNMAQLLRAQAEALEARSARIASDAAEANDPAVRARHAVRGDLARYALDVRPSRIHRFGLFAAEDIPARAAIVEYTGERIGRREAVRRWSASRTYLLRLDSYWRLDGSVGGSGAELVNHSCAPNCRFRVAEGRAFVVSLRRIAKGEELLVDYAFPAASERVACHCGAATCRGTINQ